MPTAYTAFIEKGIEFKDWALICSRGFGALLHLRDERLSPDIPDEIIPSDYYLKKCSRSERRLKYLESRTSDQIEKMCRKYNTEQRNRKHSIVKKEKDIRAKYNKMREQVLSWQTPTYEHEGLKNFMLDQIKISTDYSIDLFPVQYIPLTPKEWILKEKKACIIDIEYCKENYNKEVQRCSKNTQWIKELKKSLINT